MGGGLQIDILSHSVPLRELSENAGRKKKKKEPKNKQTKKACWWCMLGWYLMLVMRNVVWDVGAGVISVYDDGDNRYHHALCNGHVVPQAGGYDSVAAASTCLDVGEKGRPIFT